MNIIDASFEEVAAVFATAVETDIPLDPFGTFVGELKFWRQLLGATNVPARIGIDRGEVVGATWSTLRDERPRRLVVTRLAVLPNHRRRGFGTALAADAKHWALSNDATDISFFSQSEGSSLAFAEANGALIRGKFIRTASRVDQLTLVDPPYDVDDDLELLVLGAHPTGPVWRAFVALSAEEILGASASLVTGVGDHDRYEKAVMEALSMSGQDRVIACAVKKDYSDAVALAVAVIWDHARIQQNGNYVREKWRGQGLGPLVMSVCLSECRRRYPQGTVVGWAAFDNSREAAIVARLGMDPVATSVVYGLGG